MQPGAAKGAPGFRCRAVRSFRSPRADAGPGGGRDPGVGRARPSRAAGRSSAGRGAGRSSVGPAAGPGAGPTSTGEAADKISDTGES